MTLLTTGQLRQIQKLGESGMTTDVSIRNRLPFAKDPSNPNGDEVVSFGDPVAVKAWIAPILDNRFTTDGMQLVSTGDFKIRVPAGTEIHPGAEITISGDVYTVVDENSELTWPEWITARVVRNE